MIVGAVFTFDKSFIDGSVPVIDDDVVILIPFPKIQEHKSLSDFYAIYSPTLIIINHEKFSINYQLKKSLFLKVWCICGVSVAIQAAFLWGLSRWNHNNARRIQYIEAIFLIVSVFGSQGRIGGHQLTRKDFF